MMAGPATTTAPRTAVLPPGGLFHRFGRVTSIPPEGYASLGVGMLLFVITVATGVNAAIEVLAVFNVGIASIVAAMAPLRRWNDAGFSSALDATPLSANERVAWMRVLQDRRLVRVMPWTAAALALPQLRAVSFNLDDVRAGQGAVLFAWALAGAALPMAIGALILGLSRTRALVRASAGVGLIAGVLILKSALEASVDGTFDAWSAIGLIVVGAAAVREAGRLLAVRGNPGATAADEHRAAIAGGAILAMILIAAAASALMKTRVSGTLFAAALLFGGLPAVLLLIPSRLAPSRRHARIFEGPDWPRILFLAITMIVVAIGVGMWVKSRSAPAPVTAGWLSMWLGTGAAILAYGAGVRRSRGDTPWRVIVGAVIGAWIGGNSAAIVAASMATRHPALGFIVAAALTTGGLILALSTARSDVPPRPFQLPLPERLPAKHARTLAEHGADGLLASWSRQTRRRRWITMAATALALPLLAALAGFIPEWRRERLDAAFAAAHKDQRSSRAIRQANTDMYTRKGAANAASDRLVDILTHLMARYDALPADSPVRTNLGVPWKDTSTRGSRTTYADLHQSSTAIVVNLIAAAIAAADGKATAAQSAALDWSAPLISEVLPQLRDPDAASPIYVFEIEWDDGDVIKLNSGTTIREIGLLLLAAARRHDAAGNSADAVRCLTLGAAACYARGRVYNEDARPMLPRAAAESALRDALRWPLPAKAWTAIAPLSDDVYAQAMTLAIHTELVNDYIRSSAYSDSASAAGKRASIDRVTWSGDATDALASTTPRVTFREFIASSADSAPDKLLPIARAIAVWRDEYEHDDALRACWRFAACVRGNSLADARRLVGTLQDPATGAPIAYRQHDDGSVSVWCAGPDGVDDGGDPEKDVVLLVWPHR